MVLNTEWTQLEAVKLKSTADKMSYGLGIIGSKTSGVIVHTIAEGSPAYHNGNIHIGDHILKVNDHVVTAMNSEQVATILRHEKELDLIIGRPVKSITQRTDDKLLIRTSTITDPSVNLTTLVEEFKTQETADDSVSFYVTLDKGSDGLGITVANFVNQLGQEMNGIFVTSIIPGKIAYVDGRIHVGDQIVEVNNCSLSGADVSRAVELLRLGPDIVRVKVKRFLKKPYIKWANETNENFEAMEFVETEAMGTVSNNIIEAEKIKNTWNRILGQNYQIVIAELVKKTEDKSLGISLEGTVTYGDQVPRHYIRAIKKNGLIDVDGSLRKHDELLQVNEKILHGKCHNKVINILKSLNPGKVMLVCARKLAEDIVPSEKFVKAKSLDILNDEDKDTLQTYNDTNGELRKAKSLEIITGLAMWSNSITLIKLLKTEFGLGFSIIDYQDPLNRHRSVLIVRSLVPGGVAHLDGRLVPGDKIVSINDANIEYMPIKEAINLLKSAPVNEYVILGVMKPLPFPSFEKEIQSDSVIENNSTNQFYYTTLSAPALLDIKKLEIHSEKVQILPKICEAAKVNEVVLSASDNDDSIAESDILKDLLNAVVDASIDLYDNSSHHFNEILNDKTNERKDSVISSRDEAHAMSDNEIPKVLSIYPESISFSIGIIILDDIRAFKKLKRFGLLKLINQDTIQTTLNNVNCACFPVTGKFSFLVKEFSEDDHLSTQSESSYDDYECYCSRSRKSKATTSAVKTFNETSGRVLTFLSREVICYPTELEREIKIYKNFKTIGLELDPYLDEGVNGCMILSIQKGSAAELDGRLFAGDYITSVNNEGLRKISIGQVKNILRRASLLTGDLNITYISHKDISAYKDNFTKKEREIPTTKSLQSLPNYELECLNSDSKMTDSCYYKRLTKSQSAINQNSPGNISSLLWGPSTTITLNRESGKTLGISIVGGRLDVSMAGCDSDQVNGIFVKQVFERTPAAGEGSLKIGDRILEVNGIDLRNASHYYAIKVLRNAASPVHLVIQRLYDASQSSNLGGKKLLAQDENDKQQVPNLITPERKDEDSGLGHIEKGLDDTGVEPMTSNVIVHHARERSLQRDLRRKGDKEQGPTAIHVDEKEHIKTKNRVQNMFQKKDELGGEILMVDIKKSTSDEPVGISLAGSTSPNTGIFICGINPGSLADRGGRLKIGDEILELNGHMLYGRCHSDVTAVIRSVKSNVLSFLIRRKPLPFSGMESNRKKEENKAISYSKRRSFPQAQKSKTDKIEKRELKPYTALCVPEPLPVRKNEKMKNHFKIRNDSASLDDSSKKTKTVILYPDENGYSIELELINSNLFVKKGDSTTKDLENRINEGDEIISINGIPAYSLSLMEAQQLMQSSTEQLKLLIKPKCAHNFDLAASGGNIIDPNDPRIRPIVVGASSLIEIDKGPSKCLGINIVGGSDTQMHAIIIHDIIEDGAAKQDNRLAIGDQILEANGIDLRHATYEEAVEAIKQSTDVVQLRVIRSPESVAAVEEEEKLEKVKIDLIKKPYRGLGFSIVGRRSGKGAYVCTIIENGCADKDGRLMPGDLLMEVNDKKIWKLPYEEITYLLKTLPNGKVNMVIGRLKPSLRCNNGSIRPQSPTRRHHERSKSVPHRFASFGVNRMDKPTDPSFPLTNL